VAVSVPVESTVPAAFSIEFKAFVQPELPFPPDKFPANVIVPLFVRTIPFARLTFEFIVKLDPAKILLVAGVIQRVPALPFIVPIPETVCEALPLRIEVVDPISNVPFKIKLPLTVSAALIVMEEVAGKVKVRLTPIVAAEVDAPVPFSLKSTIVQLPAVGAIFPVPFRFSSRVTDKLAVPLSVAPFSTFINSIVMGASSVMVCPGLITAKLPTPGIHVQLAPAPPAMIDQDAVLLQFPVVPRE